jgi:hypothetical protein
MGSVYVKYSAQRIVLVPPPIHGAAPRSAIAGQCMNLLLFFGRCDADILWFGTVHGLPAGAKYLIERDVCGGEGHKVAVMTEMVMVVVLLTATFSMRFLCLDG